MAFLGAATLGNGEIVEFFLDPDAHEWRELERAVDPLDGVRGYVVNGRLCAWLPPHLHEEVAPALRDLLGTSTRHSLWVPICILPALRSVTVTTALRPPRDAARFREQVDQELRRCRALARRLGSDFRINHAWALVVAA